MSAFIMRVMGRRAPGRSLVPAWGCVGLVFFFSASMALAAEGVFGKVEQSQAPLMGILYDLKQTQDHAPTGVTAESYSDILDDFFVHNWDEHLLDRFYRVSRPLYTTQIFIPLFDSGDVPERFGVERTVQPTLWIIHYKAQVSPPEGGAYRFVGYADDVIVVAVNRKTVLNGSHPATLLPRLNWTSSEPLGSKSGNGKLTYGDWVDIRADEIVDLDIVIGDRPGGYMGAFLLVQKKGGTYASDAEGQPLLPIFQVAAHDTPPSPQAPQFAQGYPVWGSYQ
jgi:hypothetical protein